MDYLKNWFSLKSQLHQNKVAPRFSEREVWMCHLGTNIGFEMNGKSADFLRPTIVFKKLSKSTCLIIPLTGKSKSGTWYTNSKINRVKGSFCMHQIRMIDGKRMKYRLETLTHNEFSLLKLAFVNFIK